MQRVATLLVVSLSLVALPLLGAGCDDAETSPVTADATGDATSSGDGTSGPETTTGPISVSCDMAPVVTERPIPADDAPEEGLTLSGRLVDSTGAPAAGVFVLACTGTLCLNGETAADGTYSFTSQVRTEKHKMQVNGFIKGYMSFNFFQDPATDPALGTDVVVFDRPNSASPLPKETGGTAELAGGELVIVAPAGIKYDIGEPNELTAIKVPIDQLPPYDFDPTTCSTNPSVAYYINPLKTKLQEGTFQVTAKIGASPGAKYGIWVVDANTAEVHKEATGTADANGDVVQDAGTTLRHLDALIFVPEG